MGFIQGKRKKKINDIKKSYKERIIENFNENPLNCKSVGIEKLLWKIWHKDYGVIYDIREVSNKKDIYMNLIEVKYTAKYYKYHCYKCKYSKWVPADIVDEFADIDKYCDSEYEEYQERKGMECQ